ncbi:hypothetical protein [Clostridium butyricum]|uniref:hypothetical protein n=1 Tax=Clostridium butyricum TaxID=1492 RepID=UPI00374F5E63
MAKLPDFITAENELDGQEHVYIAQGGKTRKTLLQKIKEFIIGTATMGTTATDITGAIAEHTSQLNDIANSGYFDIAKDAKGANYKTIKSNGFYRNVTGTPTTGANGVLLVISNTDKWSIAYKWFDLSNSSITEYNCSKDGDSYSAWNKISTNEVYDITEFYNSWKNIEDANFKLQIQRSGNICVITGIIKIGLTSNMTPIFKVPTTCCPKKAIREYCEGSIIEIIQTGEVRVNHASDSLLTGEMIIINITYGI